MRTAAHSSIVLLSFGLLAQQPEPRGLEGRIFFSHELPVIRLKIPERFTFIGRNRFTLDDSALVERYHFVDGEAGQIRSMLVFQFEGFLEGVDGRYQFSVPPVLGGGDYLFSPEPVRLGRHHYVHNTWVFNLPESIRQRPGAESEHTLRLLQQAGYRVPDEWIMSRFVRAVGEQQRHELILFYLEPLAASGFSLDDFPQDSPLSPALETLSRLVTQRSLEALLVVAG